MKRLLIIILASLPLAASAAEMQDFGRIDFPTSGNPAAQLHEVAAECNADLIAVGTHGRQGWRALLGETANGVLHGASCDVLAVRV